MAKETRKKKKDLIDKHYDLSMSIALNAVRVNAIQKIISNQSDELIAIETELEKIEIEESGKRLN